MRHSHSWNAGIAMWAVLVVLAGLPPALQAGSTLWTHNASQEIKWHRVTGLGTVLVGTDDSLTCLDPDKGSVLWKRDDLKKITDSHVEEILGTPLLLVSQNEGLAMSKTKLHALDLLTGKNIWETERLKGATIGLVPVYEKNLIVLLTSPSASATKTKPDMIALNIVDGSVLWETQFEDNVDLHTAQGSGKFFQKFDLSGHQPPVYEGDSVYFTCGGVHRYDLNTGRLLWKMPYDVTEGKLKLANAQAILADGLIYDSAKGQIRAIKTATGKVKWTSPDFGAGVAQMILAGNVIYCRMGGNFYDWGKREWELKKPLGVVAVSTASGQPVWRFDKAENSITNMVYLPEQKVILIADAKNLIGLDTTGEGALKEAFRIKLEFKNKVGAGATAAKAARIGLGGLRGLAAARRDHSAEDWPVAIALRPNGIAVVRGKQHLLAFDPQKKDIPWSVTYDAPGVPGWAQLAMAGATAFAYAYYTSQAANSYAGTATNTWANKARVDVLNNYAKFVSKRHSASAATAQHAYILTMIKEGKEQGAGVVGVNMDSGDTEHQVVLKDKEPDYKVDEVTGRVFNVKGKQLTCYSVN